MLELYLIGKDIKQTSMELPSFLASEFEKDNWKLCHECFLKTKVYIKFPDYEKSNVAPANKVEHELTIKYSLFSFYIKI